MKYEHSDHHLLFSAPPYPPQLHVPPANSEYSLFGVGGGGRRVEQAAGGGFSGTRLNPRDGDIPVSLYPERQHQQQIAAVCGRGEVQDIRSYSSSEYEYPTYFPLKTQLEPDQTPAPAPAPTPTPSTTYSDPAFNVNIFNEDNDHNHVPCSSMSNVSQPGLGSGGSGGEARSQKEIRVRSHERHVTMSTRTTAPESEMPAPFNRPHHPPTLPTAGPSPRDRTSSSVSSLETMSFPHHPHPAQSPGLRNPYLQQQQQSFYRGDGSMSGMGGSVHNGQFQPVFSATLPILSTEQYDDGRGACRSINFRGAQEPEINAPLSFGITGSGYEEVPRSERKRRRSDSQPQRPTLKGSGSGYGNGGEEEDARKKARGRPRVDTKDETAADRRRTQIRMAQRAYRSRKESTITTLEKQVEILKAAKEEMSTMLTKLYESAMGKGVLQREPEFGQQLQETTDKFLAIANSATSDESKEEGDEEEKTDTSESGRRQKVRKFAPTKERTNSTVTEPVVEPPEKPPAEPPVEPPVPPWGGYTISNPQISEIEDGMDHQRNEPELANRQDDLPVVSQQPEQPTLIYHPAMMNLPQYRAEFPAFDNYPLDVWMQQLPVPNTYAHNEISFARRIHRGALERACKLICARSPPNKRFQEVFGFCLLYENRQAIETRLKRCLAATSKDTLHEWQHPFVHIGGSGTYYPMPQDPAINGYLMPKFCTGQSIGPFQQDVTEVHELLDEDMRCTLPGFAGQFFDANDIEGYLRNSGLDIRPTTDFVTGDVDLVVLGDEPDSRKASIAPSQGSSSTPIITPAHTPVTPDGRMMWNMEQGQNAFNGQIMQPYSNTDLRTMPLQPASGYPNWEGYMMKTPSSNNTLEIPPPMPAYNTAPAYSSDVGTPYSFMSSSRSLGKRTVTVNVNILLHEILNRIVCLGRAPGIRPPDVSAAIVAAVRAGV